MFLQNASGAWILGLVWLIYKIHVWVPTAFIAAAAFALILPRPIATALAALIPAVIVVWELPGPKSEVVLLVAPWFFFASLAPGALGALLGSRARQRLWP